MNLLNAKQKKYFPKIFIRRPIYICLLLLFFSITSIVAQQVQSIIIERLQKHTSNDKISIPAEAISYADSYCRNICSRQIHGYYPDCSSSDQVLFVFISPRNNGNNETNFLVTIVKPDFTDLPVDVLSDQPDTNTELVSNLSPTMEDKFRPITFLNTLNDSFEPDRPVSIQYKD